MTVPRLVGAIKALGDDALDPELAGMPVEGLAACEVMLAVLQPSRRVREQVLQPLLLDPERLGHEILPVPEQAVEQHEDKPFRAPGVGRRVHGAERGHAFL